MTAARNRDPRALLLIGVGCVAALLYANFLLDWMLRGFTGMGEVVSELESPGQENAALLRVTDVVCAGLVVSLLPWVRAGLPRGAWREVVVWATVVFALGATVAAIIATPCGPDVACTAADVQLQLHVHDAASVVSDTGLYVGVVAAWFATRRTGPVWFRRAAWWLFWIGGVVSSIVFQYFDTTQDPEWAVGVAQRVHIVGICAWIVALAAYAATVGLRARSQPVQTSGQHT